MVDQDQEILGLDEFGKYKESQTVEYYFAYFLIQAESKIFIESNDFTAAFNYFFHKPITELATQIAQIHNLPDATCYVRLETMKSNAVDVDTVHSMSYCMILTGIRDVRRHCLFDSIRLLFNSLEFNLIRLHDAPHLISYKPIVEVKMPSHISSSCNFAQLQRRNYDMSFTAKFKYWYDYCFLIF